MRVVAIVQARMGSTRLPGKVLADIGGKPMLAWVFERLHRCNTLSAIQIAIPESDNVLASYIATIWRAHLVSFGPEHDVLTRYVDAASSLRADVIVRITADCPLIDPEVVDAAIAKLTADPSRYDFVSNGIRRTYPKGLDVEVFFRDTLERLNRLATSAEDREHVCTYAYRTRPDLFRLGELWDEGGDNSDLNWSVDTAEDLEHVRRLYEHTYVWTKRFVGYRDLIDIDRRALVRS